MSAYGVWTLALILAAGTALLLRPYSVDKFSDIRIGFFVGIAWSAILLHLLIAIASKYNLVLIRW